jgi:hypothetical protein
MFLYVIIFQQMTCFFAAKTSPNMIGLTVKNIIIKKQLKKNFKVPGVLLCMTQNQPLFVFLPSAL